MGIPDVLPSCAANASPRRFRPWFPIGLVLLAWILSSCSSQRESAESSPKAPPPRGGTFRMAQDAPGSLDPALLDDVYEATVVNQIFEGLLRFDSHLNVIPCIADSWEISADGRIYTFHLKPGVLFHDGTEVKADDVAYSFSRIFRLPAEETVLAREALGHIAGSRDYAAGKAESIAGIQVLGHYDVRIELEHPYASFLAILASDPTHIVPRDYVERVGNERFAIEPIGSGPFRLARRSSDRIVLVAHEKYHMDEARLDSLIFDLPADNARDFAADAFLRGELSAAIIPHGRLAEFQAHPGTQIITRQELSLTFIGLNEAKPPFDDRRVRQAFACALDRDAILQRDRETRIPTNGILPPGMPGYTPESKLLEYDPQRARMLLAEAGYPEGRGLPAIVFTTANQTEDARQLMEEVRNQMQAVGIRIETESLAWLEFSNRLTSQDLQCFTVTWVADIPDPSSFLYPMGHHQGSANFASYSNSRVDSLLTLGQSTRTALERMEIYREAERLILRDAPIVPLFHPLSALALRQDVNGVTLTPMGIGNLPLKNVWLEPARVAKNDR